MPVDGGTSLGAATGRINIDTTDLSRVAVTTQQVGQQVEKNLGRMGAGAKKAQDSFAGVSSNLHQLAGAFGVSLGVGAVTQMGRYVVEADKIATAYDRQSVAARNLAGGQEQLNSLLRAYDQATGGAVDKASALAAVTRLQAVGFADDAQELERFARVARGVSVAMGSSQDYIVSQLQLAIANQSTMRLDQLGLGVTEVKQRIVELKAANKGLTTEMAYQNAILGLAEEKFGALADSAEAGKTGIEHVTKAWADLQLEIGQTSQSQGAISGFFDWWATGIERVGEAIGQFDEKFQRSIWRFQGKDPDKMEFAVASDDRAQMAAEQGKAVRSTRARMNGPRFGDNQEDVETLARDRYAALGEIEADSYQERLKANREYGENVANAERDYQQTISREAQDFAISRARQEADMLDSIADIHRDAARREQDQAEDLARTISRSQADSAERISDAREDANERLVEMEEDYQKNRERAAGDHKDRMMTLAGSLDAKGLLEEQKRWARENSDAKEAHTEQRDDLQEQLDERIADENESLAKSIANAQEAHQRQLEDAREADAQREADMLADFEARKVLEDEDRALRLSRMAEDHQDQMDEMARQHALDLEQIRIDKAAERDEVQKQFDLDMQETIGRNAKQQAEFDRLTSAAMASAGAFFDYIDRKAANLPMGHAARADPYVDRPMVPGSSITLPTPYNPVPGWERSRTVNIGNLQIDADGLNRQEARELIVEVLMEVIED